MKVLGMFLLLCGMAGSALAIPSVPEVDPGSATGAITLVAGGLMIWRAKRR